MKRVIMLLIAALAINNSISIAQNSNYSMLKDSTVWCYIYGSYAEATYEYFEYIALGDTIIKNKPYKKIYSFSGDFDKRSCKYAGSLREENSRIYSAGEWVHPDFILNTKDGETLLYDFSLSLGDTFAKSTDSEQPVTISFMDEMEMVDGKHKIFILNGPLIGAWIEGVGSSAYNIFTPCYRFSPGTDLYNLVEFVQDNKMMFNNCNYIFLKDDTRWIERESSENKYDYILTSYHIKGDTVINRKNYKKVYANNHYHGAIRMNIEHKVYYFKENFKKEILLYDFDWVWGKIIHSVNFKDTDFILLDRDDVTGDQLKMPLLNGKEYDYRILNSNPNPEGIPFNTLNKEVRLIKDIGLTSGVFSHVEVSKEAARSYNDLVSVYDGDKLIYLNPAFKENGELETSIRPADAELRLQVTVSNGEAVFTLQEASKTANTLLRIYRVDGRLLTTRSLDSGKATVGNLPTGVYYYRTESGQGMPANGKFMME